MLGLNVSVDVKSVSRISFANTAHPPPRCGISLLVFCYEIIQLFMGQMDPICDKVFLMKWVELCVFVLKLHTGGFSPYNWEIILWAFFICILIEWLVFAALLHRLQNWGGRTTCLASMCLLIWILDWPPWPQIIQHQPWWVFCIWLSAKSSNSSCVM